MDIGSVLESAKRVAVAVKHVETGKFCTRGNLLDLRAALKGVEA